jgi:hypothetical protein
MIARLLVRLPTSEDVPHGYFLWVVLRRSLHRGAFSNPLFFIPLQQAGLLNQDPPQLRHYFPTHTAGKR